MVQINENFLKLTAGYLFPEIGRRVSEFSKANPNASIIRLGIGDVTEPLPAAIVKAMHNAVDEMASRETFHGYGPEQGYAFLREPIAAQDYQARGINVSADEIFISDGSQVRLRQHSGHLWTWQPYRRDRPGLSGIRGYERDGRAYWASR